MVANEGPFGVCGAYPRNSGSEKRYDACERKPVYSHPRKFRIIERAIGSSVEGGNGYSRGSQQERSPGIG